MPYAHEVECICCASEYLFGEHAYVARWYKHQFNEGGNLRNVRRRTNPDNRFTNANSQEINCVYLDKFEHNH